MNDQQALEQALLVAKAQTIDVNNIRRWSKNEGEPKKCSAFLEQLQKASL